MKQDFDEVHYFAGYPGKDSMREKARRLMEEELMGTKMTMPGSFSEPGREKMRLYKKGGHVKHHHKHKGHHSHHDDMHKIKGEHTHHEEKKRAHLHKLQREGLHETERALEKESHLKHGGRVHHKKRHHHADGGHAHLFPMHYHEESGMKRTYNRHAPETHQHKSKHKNIEGGSLTNLHIPTPKLNEESVKGAEMMRKGGHMHQGHHKKHHKPIKRATGGTVYEHEMRGEKPSHHLTKINYEKDMKGTHPSRVPPMSGTKRKNPGACDESFGTVFKKGGRATKKMAAGGVAKIRHGVADKRGLPIMKKRKMGY